jgi:hypothetical protein
VAVQGGKACRSNTYRHVRLAEECKNTMYRHKAERGLEVLLGVLTSWFGSSYAKKSKVEFRFGQMKRQSWQFTGSYNLLMTNGFSIVLKHSK